MNVIKIVFLGITILMSFGVSGQNQYVINLKAENWNIKPEFYRFSEVVDERAEKNNIGKVFSNNKLIVANFPNPLPVALKKLLDSAIKGDSSFTPITVSIEKFSLMETGSFSNHKIVLDFSITFYRYRNEKSYKLYETNGKPELTLRGNYPGAAEKLVGESLKNVFQNFNEWIKLNAESPPLANSVNVIYDKGEDVKNEKSDTIIWNENYKLKWSDFRGSVEETGFMAQSNCIFSYRSVPVSKKGVLDLHIRLNACFDRRQSWVKPNQHRDTLLAHEQLHFDICELYIREVRKKILNTVLDPMEYSQQINSIFEKAWNDYQEEQQRYDDETRHGIVDEKQQWWQDEIRKKLINNLKD